MIISHIGFYASFYQNLIEVYFFFNKFFIFITFFKIFIYIFFFTKEETINLTNNTAHVMSNERKALQEIISFEKLSDKINDEEDENDDDFLIFFKKKILKKNLDKSLRLSIITQNTKESSENNLKEI